MGLFGFKPINEFFIYLNINDGHHVWTMMNYEDEKRGKI